MDIRPEAAGRLYCFIIQHFFREIKETSDKERNFSDKQSGAPIMSFCSFSKEFNENAFTTVENQFVTKYMPDADGFAVKVYLYCCLSLFYHILETLSIKNFNDAVFGVVFYVLALIQTAGRGIHYLSAFPAASPWRQLSPADKLQHRESRERLSVFLLPYPEARSPGFPVSIIPLFPLFARSGRPPPAPSRYIIYYKHI